MGLDEEIVISDTKENNWYLTIKLNPKVNKIDIIRSIIKTLRHEELRLMVKLPSVDLYKYGSKVRTLYIQNDISTQ
jgi:hypothetical protein